MNKLKPSIDKKIIEDIRKCGKLKQANQQFEEVKDTHKKIIKILENENEVLKIQIKRIINNLIDKKASISTRSSQTFCETSGRFTKNKKGKPWLHKMWSL